MKKVFVYVVLALIFGIIVYVFWQEEMRYTLPTPVPESFEEVPLGTCVDSEWNQPEETAALIHFFSPDCPCSRFNLKHFHFLYKSYKDQVHFYVVIPNESFLKKARRLVSDDIPILIDPDKKWRETFGVYATPQAVILDHHEIYYRGNYNKARFCTIPGSNFAEASLNMMLSGEPIPQWEEVATIAYGCQLPDSISVASAFSFLPLITFEK